MGDCILSALAGKRDSVVPLNTADCLLNTPDNSVPTQIPMCVMDGTDVETVMVVSEWMEIDLGASEDGESLQVVNTNEGSSNAVLANDPEETETNVSIEENFESEAGSNTDRYSGESVLQNKEDTSLDGLHGSSVDKNQGFRNSEAEELNCNIEEGQIFSSNATPTVASTPTTALSPEDAAVSAAHAGTRRSARKPKKTWKIKMVNLQKQRKKPASKVVNSQKETTKPVVPKPNPNSITSLNR